jgi:hypothetical protein
MKTIKSAILLIGFSCFLTFASLAQSKKPGIASDTIAQSTKVCPHCHHSDNVIPIRYGKPTQETIKKAEKGEVKLGGCMVSATSPKFYCNKDKTAF